MENISGADIRTAIVVICAVIAMMISVLTLIGLMRKERAERAKPIDTMRGQLTDHEKRIARLEAASTANVTENRLMMRMQLALVRHAIDGNNVEGLRDMREEVQRYLIDK